MENLHNHQFHNSFFPLLFLLQFLSFHLSSSTYTLPDKYFVNCGSGKDITVDHRNFVGDLNSGSFSFTKQSSVEKDGNQSTDSSIYQTARIFRQPSSYEFDIHSNEIYLVRLHFFPFSSSTDLSTAVFNVSASGFLLLGNFTVQNTSNPPLIKEFFLSIDIVKFKIYFVPQGSSLAFVNAIEVFPVPVEFIPGNATSISPSGSSSSYRGILSKPLRTTYRINVGGLTVTPENDTLWRYWEPDDRYLSNPSTAKISQVYTSRLNYYQGGATEYSAPTYVYQTAKEMNINDSSQSNIFNITWSFNVSKKSRHFVRVHFCDIVTLSMNVIFFSLYINRNFQVINPHNISGDLAAPFYIDFVVDPDDSGLTNVSIGPQGDSTIKNAFLNGLEIMEIMEESSSVTSVPTSSKPKKNHVFLIVGSVLGGLALICILAVVLFLRLKRRKPKPVETLDWSPLTAFGGWSSHSRATEGTITGSPVSYLNLGLKISFAEIQFATNKFDKKLLVGKGGFGKVYRGTLRNGMTVAIKRSEPGSGQGLSEFQTEIMVLSKIRHRHLVSLIGYCDERSEMILVYEFMAKGTLRDHLYITKFPCLSWKQRLEICIGAARGLHYLHKGSEGVIIHRDVKSTNILLDENHIAKVADFGLSRLGPSDQTHVSTNVKGTFGYLDPEYFRTEQLTEKSDVYSFGVVLLEVLCARPAINPSLPREQVNLAEWGMVYKNKGLLEQIVDPLLNGQINPNSLRKFAETVEKCLQEDGADRPTMGDVLWDLEYALQLQQTETRREPHEDSATDPSSMLPLPNLQRFPSLSSTFGADDMPIMGDDCSSSVASEVFSQMKIHDAR